MVKSVPFDAGSGFVAASAVRSPLTCDAGRTSSFHANFTAEAKVGMYRMSAGAVRMVSDNRPVGQSLDCFA